MISNSIKSALYELVFEINCFWLNIEDAGKHADMFQKQAFRIWWASEYNLKKSINLLIKEEETLFPKTKR